MAIVRAVKTGVWSDPTVWNTGALPTAADDVYSNTFTVTIDVSPTVLSISNAAASGVTAGGTFVPTNGITLTCTGAGVVAGSSATTCFPSSLTTGQACSIVGNVTAGSTGNANGARNTGAGTLNITGNVSGASDYGVLNTAGGTINITGNASGGTAIGSAGAWNNSTGTINITGNTTAGSGTLANGVGSTSACVISVVGTVTASTAAAGISSSSISATINLTGPFITSANGTNPVYALNWKWATTAPATYYQVRTVNTLLIRPLYTADSVGGNPATSNVRSGTVYGPAGELTGTCAVPPAASVGVGVPVDNTSGTAAITAASIRSAMGLAAADLDTQLAALPTAAEVRIEMDSNSTKLGADTFGTTTLLSRLTSGRAGNLDNLDATISSRPTAADIATAVWAAATRTLTTAIDNSATIAAAVWAYASGRTITGGTVDTLTNAPSVPSAATIASQVRTELSTELGRIDVATSTRLAAASYSAAPSAATTATAVRSELATELGRLDATVSSRLAPAGTLARVTLVDTTTNVTNSSQVDNAAIADAVRTELTPELARVANCSTTQEVGDIVEGAMALPEN